MFLTVADGSTARAAIASLTRAITAGHRVDVVDDATYLLPRDPSNGDFDHGSHSTKPVSMSPSSNSAPQVQPTAATTFEVSCRPPSVAEAERPARSRLRMALVDARIANRTVATIEFQPTLERQRVHAVAHDQPDRAAIYDRLLDTIEAAQ
jgi:hypothetical protein